MLVRSSSGIGKHLFNHQVALEKFAQSSSGVGKCYCPYNQSAYNSLWGDDRHLVLCRYTPNIPF